MLCKPYWALTLAVLFLGWPGRVSAQTVPSATKPTLPFSVGAGLSGFNPDHGHGHLLGGTLWVDYRPVQIPWFLHGIGIEVEARDLNYGRSLPTEKDLREDTAEGGLLYSRSVARVPKLSAYGKYMMGYGNTDYWSTATLARHHDSRTISAMGGGVEYHVTPRVWLRADYEYQFWPNFFKHPETTEPPGKLNAQGFTVGALYHFGGRPRR